MKTNLISKTIDNLDRFYPYHKAR